MAQDQLKLLVLPFTDQEIASNADVDLVIKEFNYLRVIEACYYKFIILFKRILIKQNCK